MFDPIAPLRGNLREVAGERFDQAFHIVCCCLPDLTITVIEHTRRREMRAWFCDGRDSRSFRQLGGRRGLPHSQAFLPGLLSVLPFPRDRIAPPAKNPQANPHRFPSDSHREPASRTLRHSAPEALCMRLSQQPGHPPIWEHSFSEAAT